jgi:hypothetical protein
MRRAVLICLLTSYLSLLEGCSYVIVHSDILKDNPDQLLIDPNTPRVKMTISGLEQPCRIKYGRYYSDSTKAIVKGEVPQGRKYPVIIDSGFPVFIHVNDNIVRENNLAIRPIAEPSSTGACHLPFLKLGKVTIRNPRCMYTEQHWELQVCGMPIYKEKWIIVGLNLMKRFRYILLDGVRRELELSAEQSFAPAEPDNWSQYTFTIERHMLMVDIPIEDQDLHIMFDTGCGYGLTLSSKLWGKLSERLKVKDSRDFKKASYNAGRIPCQKMLISNLTIGNKLIKNAEVLVLPEDDEGRGHLGMKFFKDTVVVLDFERNLMWVKNDGTN